MPKAYWSAALIVLTSALLLQAQSPDLLAKALQTPNDEGILSQVTFTFRDTTDPTAISGLKQLFEAATEKNSRQRLATLLMNLGQRDEAYFNELVKYASEAITTDAPLPYFYDPQGNAVRGQTPLAFTNWCEDHQLKSEECNKVVLGYAVDVFMLASVKDRRAIPLLRQGLSVHNDAIVTACVTGLASMKDTDAIPLIEAAILRFPPKLQSILASPLVDFDDVRVSRLLDRFVTDKKWRQELDERIRKRHEP